MCCDSPSDGALLLHEIMVAGPMELPVTPPSLCSGFDERATCCQPSSRPNQPGDLGWLNIIPLYSGTGLKNTAEPLCSLQSLIDI